MYPVCLNFRLSCIQFNNYFSFMLQLIELKRFFGFIDYLVNVFKETRDNLNK